MDEAIKHPSLTSVAAVQTAMRAFAAENDTVILALAGQVRDCPIHGSIEALDQFWVAYDRKRNEMVKAARLRLANLRKERRKWI